MCAIQVTACQRTTCPGTRLHTVLVPLALIKAPTALAASGTAIRVSVAEGRHSSRRVHRLFGAHAQCESGGGLSALPGRQQT